MDRYQFEDLISDYIENNLSLSKRKEFEQYLNTHPEAVEHVNSIRSVIESLRSLRPIKTSQDFLENLQRRIDYEKSRPSQRIRTGKTIFGFTPIYAGMITVVVAALVFIGIELIPGSISDQPILQPTLSTDAQMRTGTTLQANQPTNDALVDVNEDTSDTEDQSPIRNIDINDQIQYVKNPR